jgi:organic radical activating enzyme
MTSAYLIEAFSSVQGEGLLCGERQIFIRFAGCNLQCGYCDTAAPLEKPANFDVRPSGRKAARPQPNPVSVEDLVQIVKKFNEPHGLHHSVALTGGEPLLQADFLAEFLPADRVNNLRHFLETNGALPDELEKVIKHVDIISADVKLESATGQPAQYDKNRRFLEIAFRKPTIVKVVVSDKTTVAEIDEVAEIVASVSPAIPMVIQPVTGRDCRVEASAHLLNFQEIAKNHLSSVRVIPQIHKILGLP